MSPIEAFIADYSLAEPEYLGDGVYMAHEGWQFWLLTEREGGVVHAIALEPHAVRRFAAWVEEKAGWTTVPGPC